MAIRQSFQPGEFCWVDYNAHDMSAALDFYGQLFGWKSVPFGPEGGPPYLGLMLGDAMIGGIGQMSDEMKAQGIPPVWNCYVSVADCAASEKKAVELGGKVVFPTYQAGEFGKLAFLSDPGGAVFALWQALSFGGKQAWGEDNSPCWAELTTWDIEQQKSYYENLFGWTCNYFPGTPTKYYVANVGDTMVGGLMEMNEQWQGMPSTWNIYFHVADVDQTVAKVAQLGGKVCFPPFDAGEVGRISGCMDPNGGFFYLIKMKNPA